MTPSEMTPDANKRAIRASSKNSRRISRLCCRGMRPARCAAATGSASKRRCATDPDLMRHVDLVREELAETIHLNETLGAPPSRVADKLMAAIDAEATAARKRAPGAVAGWLTGFFANLSPRTMAVAASFAMLAIALQAVAIVDIFTRPQAAVRQARRAGRRAQERHFCDGALRAPGQRRRDHQFPAE